jgi:Dynamin family
VLEAISGVPFPRGGGLVTRCATQLIMKAAPEGQPWSARASVTGPRKALKGCGPVEGGPAALTQVISDLQNALTAGNTSAFSSEVSGVWQSSMTAAACCCAGGWADRLCRRWCWRCAMVGPTPALPRSAPPFSERGWPPALRLLCPLTRLTSTATATCSLRLHTQSIVIEVRAPGLPDLTLIDLPGIIRTATQGQSAGVMQEVNSLVRGSRNKGHRRAATCRGTAPLPLSLRCCCCIWWCFSCSARHMISAI